MSVESAIYWTNVVGWLHDFFVLGAALSWVISVVIAFVVGVVIIFENDAPGFKHMFKIVALAVSSIVVFSLLTAFVPSESTLAAMYVIPRLEKHQITEPLPKNLLSLEKKYLDGL